jgi:multiple sugar transport system ATP-binding protein
VREVAKMVRIDHKLANRSTQLSGGEMQRVAIGRALVRRPSIYLMDEPLSSLDAKLRAELRLELKRIQKELGATMLYVTHDQTEAMTMADRIGVINQGGGWCRSARRAASTRIPIGVRTEHLAIAKANNGAVTGKVNWIERLGDQNHLHIDVNQQQIVSLVDPDEGLDVGDEVAVTLRKPLFFAADGQRVR